MCVDLNDFNGEQFDIMQLQIEKLKGSKEQVIEAFGFVQDCEMIFHCLQEKMLTRLQQKPTPQTLVSTHLGLIKRSPLILNKIEQHILDLNKDWLFDLVQSR